MRVFRRRQRREETFHFLFDVLSEQCDVFCEIEEGKVHHHLALEMLRQENEEGSGNVQRCIVDERLSGAAHVQFDSCSQAPILREEHFVASERIIFSVVFLKMDFALVRSDGRAKASRSNLSVFVS